MDRFEDIHDILLKHAPDDSPGEEYVELPPAMVAVGIDLLHDLEEDDDVEPSPTVIARPPVEYEEAVTPDGAGRDLSDVEGLHAMIEAEARTVSSFSESSPSLPTSPAFPSASPSSPSAAPKAVEYALTLSDDEKHAFDKLGLQLAFLNPVEFFRMCTILSEAERQLSGHQDDVDDILNKTLYFYSDASFFHRIKAVVRNHNLKHRTQLKEADLLLHVQDHVRSHLEAAELPTPTFTNRRQLLAASDTNFISWEGPSKQETVNLVHSFSLLAAWHDSGQLRKGMCAAAVWKQSQNFISQKFTQYDDEGELNLIPWLDKWICIYSWPRTLREHVLLKDLGLDVIISLDIYMMTRVAIYQIENIKNEGADFFRSPNFFEKTINKEAAEKALGINDESTLLHHIQQNFAEKYDWSTQKNRILHHFLHIAIIESLLLRTFDCAKEPFIFEDHFYSRKATDVADFTGIKFLKTCSPMTLTGMTPYIRLTETPYSSDDVMQFLRSQEPNARLLVYNTKTPGECWCWWDFENFESFEYDDPVYRFERTADDEYTLVQRVNFTD